MLTFMLGVVKAFLTILLLCIMYYMITEIAEQMWVPINSSLSKALGFTLGIN